MRSPLPRRLGRAAGLLAVVAGLAVGAVACGDDGDTSDQPDTSLIPPQSTESETAATDATTASTDPASTEPSQPTAFTAEAADAVNELKAAWEAGDQARARAIAPGAVVDALFLVPADGFAVQGCDLGEFETSTCTYRNRATGAFIVVDAIRSEAGWQIAAIDVNQD